MSGCVLEDRRYCRPGKCLLVRALHHLDEARDLLPISGCALEAVGPLARTSPTLARWLLDLKDRLILLDENPSAFSLVR